MNQSRYLPVLAAFNALVAIAIGAVAAHAVHGVQAREWIETATRFQLPHAVAVFALLGWRDTPQVRIGAWALTIGSLVFAVSLDGLALGMPRGFSALAPFGGALMIAGWAWIMVTALGKRRN